MSSNFTVYNMEDGFVEGFVRGLRSTFLSDMDYTNLKEGGQRNTGGSDNTKEDFEDLRLTLQETDYGNFLQQEVSEGMYSLGKKNFSDSFGMDPSDTTTSKQKEVHRNVKIRSLVDEKFSHLRNNYQYLRHHGPALDPKIIANRCTAKWVKEFKYIRATATGQLAKFLDFITYEYMIDNILDLIKAATSSQSVDVEAVMESCHPLGALESGVMKSILAYEDLAEDFHNLYRTILVDTPVGKYFTMFLQESVDQKAAMDPESVRSTFTEIPMTLIENSIKKFYLEDFYYFCVEEIGNETGVIMGELLSTRADMLTINVAYNSLAADAGRASKTNRATLFPSFGHLYPGGAELLANVDDEDGLRRALAKSYPEYAHLWDSAPVDGRGVRDLSDAFFRRTVKQLELAFEGAFHYGPFYAYAKLKEQECKNIAWIATCMEHAVYSEMERIVPIFSRVVKTTTHK